MAHYVANYININFKAIGSGLEKSFVIMEKQIVSGLFGKYFIQKIISAFCDLD